MSDDPVKSTSEENALACATCPRCTSTLDASSPVIRCQECGQVYPRLGTIPVLLPDPDSWIPLWRVQLEIVERQAQNQFAGIEAQLQFGDALPSTVKRVGAMIGSARQQITDIRAVLAPLLPLGARQLEKGVTVKSTLEQIHYLFRDWAWDGGKHLENESAVKSVEKALKGASLGRTLVLGAGASRLAYDLHIRCGATETVAVDLDSLLLTVAHHVIRGEKVSMTEASISVHEIEGASRRWELSAPTILDDSKFHFVFADGLQPPFAPETFDTVVTPWFMDRIPPDLRDFVGVIEMLLKPGGRWVNYGPLLYPPELPLDRRFSRDEVFDIADRAGFRIDEWSTESGAHLLSPYLGRGRVEWVLTFVAVKEDSDAAESDTRMPPSWLVLPYLSVPSFEGQSVFVHPEPLVQAVISGIDGERSINELTQGIVQQIAEPNVDPRVVRDNVRRALAAAHPACRRGTLIA